MRYPFEGYKFYSNNAIRAYGRVFPRNITFQYLKSMNKGGEIITESIEIYNLSGKNRRILRLDR